MSNDFFEWQQSLIENIKSDIHKCLPAIVKSYNVDTQTADVQITLKGVNPVGKEFLIPILYDVPVWQYRGNSLFVHQPIEINTYGFVLIMDRDIDMYKTYGNIIKPLDKRKHDISDAIFIPGFYASNSALSNIDNSKLTIGSTNGKVNITVDKDGNINIANQNGSIDLDSYGNIIINCPSGVEINAPDTSINGNLSVDSGDTGYFVSLDGRIVTVTSGIITSIV